MSKKKVVRRKFRESVFERDGFTCKCCGYKPEKESLQEELDAHHITDRTEMPGGGYVKENGISLCNVEDGCHVKAEKFHISDGQEWEDGMHPNDLYEMIESSKELAIDRSKKLLT